MSKFSVCVVTGTFGSNDWIKLAHDRAWASVPDKIPWIHAHRDTLHEARNACLESVETDWVVICDADDELEPAYLEAMAEAEGDVRAPIARYVKNGRTRVWRPTVAGHKHRCEAACLPYGNWVLIGAAVRTELALEVGGFRDFPWSEDWDYFLRLYQAGATFGWADGAYYRAHVRKSSRNRGATQAEKLAAHRAIATANKVPVP